MKRYTMLLFALLAFSGVAHACDSYEDCMKKPTLTKGALPQYDLSIGQSLKAIAFKLDDISRKLDDTNNSIEHAARVSGCSEAMKNAGACR